MTEQPAIKSKSNRGVLVTVAIVLVASFVLGGVTSLAQSLLPAALLPLANSVSGWTMIAALVVWLARLPLVPSAVCGAVSFVALNLGYVLVSTARGFPTGWLTWSVIGLLAGPVIGIAAWALRHADAKWVAVGSGVIAGVLIGDGFRGLLFLTESTGWFYWTLVTVIGVAVVVAFAIRRLRTAQTIGIQVAVTIGVALVMNVALLAL
jgi:Family of unknown function (DUF6518)